MAKLTSEISEYERQRLEKIAQNRALLQQLQLDAASAGLGPVKSSNSTTSAPKTGQKRKRVEKKVKEEVVPRRTSARLRGIVADSELAAQKAEEERVAYVEAEKVKRQRLSADVNVSIDLGEWNRSGNFPSKFAGANPGVRTFDAQKTTSDKELRGLREKFGSLALWKDVQPAKIKITPERIYSLGFHPDREKALVFAGDKMGNLGVFDGSQNHGGGRNENINTKKEEEEEDKVDLEDEDEEEQDIKVSSFKIHTRTISAFQFAPNDASKLYTASYDSSIRKLDLNKGVAVEVWAPPGQEMDEPLSGVEIPRSNSNLLYFTSLEGRFGIYDMREPVHKSQSLMQLSDKKIGGFSLHPLYDHILATASLDRCLKLWDLRKISGKGEDRLPGLIGQHESKLSVSHAAFNAAGQVATASYDDTVKIYDFNDAENWKVGVELDDEKMSPTTIVPHNNQTGRWVTM